MRDLRVAVDRATLAVTYSSAGSTALVAVHGASAGTRSHQLYTHLHAVVPRLGIGVATFDRRGEGESDGSPSVDRLELQAGDVLAVAAALGVDHVGLWGFSQGAWVAPLAARGASAIAFLVLVASTGVSPADQMMYGVAEQIRRSGYNDDTSKRALDLRRQFYDWVRNPSEVPGSTVGKALATELARASAEPWWPLVFLPTDLPDQEASETWRAEMDFDPLPVFADVAVPTLLFYGADDSWTPVQASVDAWRAGQGAAVDVVVIPEASHELTLPGGELAPLYEERLVEWLTQRLPNEAP